MSIKLKSRREIELMRSAGSIVAEVLLQLKEVAVPGISTGELNRIALRMTKKAGAEALFLGVKNPYAKMAFPGVICASINDEVVHGIPSDQVKLSEGDILSIDFGVRLAGYCGDSAITVGIGEISSQRHRLIEVTSEVLQIAVSKAGPGKKWSQVAGPMQRYAEAAGFSVVEDFVGHGIGREMHEEPRVPNFVGAELLANDFVLTEGMVLAVEPMINAGSCEVKTLKNGWTVVTKDGKSSAHFEHTIAITDNGCEVLTV
jgi:methionyl aminopeptidase